MFQFEGKSPSGNRLGAAMTTVRVLALFKIMPNGVELWIVILVQQQRTSQRHDPS
jgi:hypothetical protein